ncbi:MAG: toprim domain-containing protein [Magnetococcales bacterium]|nr:toprim domain-containing protein [Magnetococcales bacterium]
MNAAKLKESIDLHDLANRLGLQRQKEGENYRAPWREDKKPSLSVFADGRKWKDHGSAEGGDCIDLVKRVKGVDTQEAMRFLHELYGFPFDRPANDPPDQANHENAAIKIWTKTKNHKNLHFSAQYLTETRKLPADRVTSWQGQSFGYSDWSPSKGNAKEHGPAVTFPVVNKDGVVTAVNMRYLEEGHEPKMRFLGEASGGFFIPDLAIRKAPIIWLVESPIDALTLTAAGCPAMAFLSVSMAGAFPFSWLKDHQRLMILADNDPPGMKAAATLYHRAISGGVTVQWVEWIQDFKDPNDALQAGKSLEQIRTWANKADTSMFPAKDVFVPTHEFGRLNHFICYLDTTEYHRETEDGPEYKPVAGFRVYRLDPIIIHHPATAIDPSDSGNSARKVLVAYRRTDSNVIQRRVIGSEDISSSNVLQKLGHLHNARQMALLLQTLGRDQRHSQESVGVIGLVHVGGKLQLMDAKNSHLTDEECVYHRLHIPSAPPGSARGILEQVDGLMKQHLGVIQLGWFLGSLMKVFLGFWPHLVIGGHSGSGKTVIAGIMQKLIGFDLKESSELQTPYRRMKAISNHLYPVLFDEISRIDPKDCDDFVNLMHVSYRASVRHHGMKGVFLVAAPVCLIGQDNPITDAAINTKIVQFDMDGMKNEVGMFTPKTPFPVREWAHFLMDRWDKVKANERLKIHTQSLFKHLKRDPSDTNIGRLVDNYAALQFALEEVFTFSGYTNDAVWQTVVDLMNQHLVETALVRRESLAIMEKLAEEITLANRHETPIPFLVDEKEGGRLFIHTATILPFLEKRGHHFPVTTSKRLVAHLSRDGLLLGRNVRKTIGPNVYKCAVLSLRKLEKLGVDWPTRTEVGSSPYSDGTSQE